MNLSVELPEHQAEALRAIARRLGVAPERLAQAAISDLLANRDAAFENAAAYVLRKNAELYERLR